MRVLSDTLSSPGHSSYHQLHLCALCIVHTEFIMNCVLLGGEVLTGYGYEA